MAATTMYPEMGMRFWLKQAEAEFAGATMYREMDMRFWLDQASDEERELN